MKLTPRLLFIFLLAIGSSLADDYVYEFGSDENSPIVYTTDGSLGLMDYVKEIVIPDSGVQVNYLKVVVTSFSPPKVDFDARAKKVTIRYSWSQTPLGTSYRITAHGDTAHKSAQE